MVASEAVPLAKTGGLADVAGALPLALRSHGVAVTTLVPGYPAVKAALKDEKAQNYFRSFDRQAYHAHEVGLRDNLVFVAAAIYFAVRGSAGFGIDNWFSDWVIRLF